MQNINIFLIFFHIYKSGGTTFNWLLQENFPDKVIYAEPPLENIVPLDKNKLLKYLKKLNTKNKKLISLSSHNFEYSCYQLAKIPFTILRNPHERNWSAYNFQNDHFLENNSFENYLIDNENSQTKSLSLGMLNLDEKIITDILNTFYIGILERFDESMIYLESISKKFGIHLDLSYPEPLNKQNKKAKILNSNKFNSLEKKYYSLDFMIYEKANHKLDQELNKISGLEKKIFNFKARCNKLREIKYKGKRENYGQGPEYFNIIK